MSEQIRFHATFKTGPARARAQLEKQIEDSGLEVAKIKWTTNTPDSGPNHVEALITLKEPKPVTPPKRAELKLPSVKADWPPKYPEREPQ